MLVRRWGVGSLAKRGISHLDTQNNSFSAAGSIHPCRSHMNARTCWACSGTVHLSRQTDNPEKDRFTRVRLSNAIKTSGCWHYRNTDCLTSVENRRSRCWKFSPVRTLQHRSESLSDRTDTLAGDRDRGGELDRGHAYEYYSADLHWIDSDYRILQLTFGVKHKNTKTLQSSDICTSKVRRSYSLCPKHIPLMSGCSQPDAFFRY